MSNNNTSLLSIMGAFQNHGLQSNHYYTYNEIERVLDKLCGYEFDRNIGAQLRDQCQTNYKQQIQLDDFARVIIDAEQILSSKYQQTVNATKQLMVERQTAKQKMDEVQGNSRFVNTKLLHLQLRGATGLKSSLNYTQCYVTITVNQQQQMCQGLQGYNKQNPEFNQEFLFDINQPRELGQIQLYVLVDQQPTLLGLEKFPLATNSFYISLKNALGQETGIEVQMITELVEDKRTFFQQQLYKYDQALAEAQNNERDYEYDLNCVRFPFNKNILTGSVRPSEPVYFSVPNDMITSNPNFRPTQSQLNINGNQIAMQKTSDNPPYMQSNRPSIGGQSKPSVPSDELQTGFYIFLLFGVLSVVISFVKPAFLDLLIFFCLLLIVYMDFFDADHIKLVCALNCFSILQDTIWMYEYQNLWNQNHRNNPDESSYNHLYRLLIVLVSCSLMVKLILLYILYHYFRESKQNRIFGIKFFSIEFVVGLSPKNLFVK